MELRAVPEEGMVEIRCTNFNNAFGTGTTKPIEIASLNDRKITLQFWAFLLGNKNEGARRIDYTFYIEE